MNRCFGSAAAMAAVLLIGCASPEEGAATAPNAEPPAPQAPPPAVVRIPAPQPTILPEETPAPPEPTKGLVEVFPHVRLDAASRCVEFDGVVPIDCHDARTPTVYLEVVACLRNTKEHEAIVVTDALPSHVHAALLAAGLVPGKPGSWRVEQRQLITIPPEGPEVTVTISWRDGAGVEISRSAEDMVLSAENKQHLREAGARWLFAGSRFVNFQGKEFYDADGMGTLVGLATFGAETIAWSRVLSHESAVQEPELIADGAMIPPFGTPVVVRIKPTR
jgi:hypothetical protein